MTSDASTLFMEMSGEGRTDRRPATLRTAPIARAGGRKGRTLGENFKLGGSGSTVWSSPRLRARLKCWL